MTRPVFVFLCDSDTRAEVMKRQLVGTTPDQDWFSDLRPGDVVLVYDYSPSSHKAFGPFRVTKVGRPLVAEAWNRKFPFQAGIEDAGSRREIPLGELRQVLPRFLRPNSDKPCPYFQSTDAEQLTKLFGLEQSPSITPHTERPTEPRFRTPQGFDVRSKAELSIANLLFQWRLECHYETGLPPDDKFKCDFFLPQHDVYLEYWGKPSDPDYQRRMSVKKSKYRREGLRLIELFPDDERDLAEALARELRKFDVPLGLSPPRHRGIFFRLIEILRSLVSK